MIKATQSTLRDHTKISESTFHTHSRKMQRTLIGNSLHWRSATMSLDVQLQFLFGSGNQLLVDLVGCLGKGHVCQVWALPQFKASAVATPEIPSCNPVVSCHHDTLGCHHDTSATTQDTTLSFRNRANIVWPMITQQTSNDVNAWFPNNKNSGLSLLLIIYEDDSETLVILRPWWPRYWSATWTF